MIPGSRLARFELKLCILLTNIQISSEKVHLYIKKHYPKETTKFSTLSIHFKKYECNKIFLSSVKKKAILMSATGKKKNLKNHNFSVLSSKSPDIYLTHP